MAGLSDLRIEPVSIAEQGENVFMRWRLTGTHRRRTRRPTRR